MSHIFGRTSQKNHPVDVHVQVQDVNSGNIETIYFVQVWAGCVQTRPHKHDLEAAGEFSF